MNPVPKPEKKEKTKPMSVYEFRKKYGSKSIKERKGKFKKPKNSHVSRFYASRAWIWFSRYIQLKYSDERGMVNCATSGKLMSITDRNCVTGHCIRVFESNNTHMNTAFDERNVLPQSFQENRFYGGRPEVMRDKIDKIHGPGTFEELTRKAKTFKKYTDFEMRGLANKYRLLTYELLSKKKGLSRWWV